MPDIPTVPSFRRVATVLRVGPARTSLVPGPLVPARRPRGLLFQFSRTFCGLGPGMARGSGAGRSCYQILETSTNNKTVPRDPVPSFWITTLREHVTFLFIWNLYKLLSFVHLFPFQSNYKHQDDWRCWNLRFPSWDCSAYEFDHQHILLQQRNFPQRVGLQFLRCSG